MKRCLHCERPAEFSVCAVISTLGRPGRLQRCTASLRFCSLCLHRLCGGVEGSLAIQVREALQTALRALTGQLVSKLDPEKYPDQKSNGLKAEEMS
jgi:hypothetical protein